MPESKPKEQKSAFNLNIEEMTRAGLHFGHKTSNIHPKMMPYLSGSRNSVHIIDLAKTKEKLAEALEFTQKIISENKTLLLVGTKVQMKNLVKETAQKCGLPYVCERWLGGTFTNFGTIFKRLEYYKDLENKKKTGELEKYTKKERVEMDKELEKLEVKFGGIKDLTKLPDAIFVCDLKKDRLAVSEAKAKGIAVVAICDTNTDPTLVDYPIPANDDAIASVKYILSKFEAICQKSTK